VIASFKSQCISNGATCPVLGIELDFKNSHVSYTERSFDSLLSDFLEMTNNSYESVETQNPHPNDLDQRSIIKDSELRSEWLIFHNQNALLELWSAEANLRKVR